LGNNIVWETPNPFNPGAGDDYSPYQPFGVSGVRDTAIQAQKDHPKEVKNVAWDKLLGTWVTEDGVDLYPAIRVNYRGAIADVPVDIVNSVTGFQVNWKEASEVKPGGAIGFLDMRWERRRLDNDLGPGVGPKWTDVVFGAEFDAEVTLSSIRGNSIKWTDLGPVTAASLADAQAGAPGTKGPTTTAATQAKLFTTNYGPISDSPAWTNLDSPALASSLNWGFNEAKWGIAGIKKNGSKDGTDKTITFYYMPPTLDPSLRPTTETGKITAKLQKQTQTVTFKNIGVWVEYK
jgi:hypothetical protein